MQVKVVSLLCAEDTLTRRLVKYWGKWFRGKRVPEGLKMLEYTNVWHGYVGLLFTKDLLSNIRVLDVFNMMEFVPGHKLRQLAMQT
jgi:hypothetical protein